MEQALEAGLLQVAYIESDGSPVLVGTYVNDHGLSIVLQANDKPVAAKSKKSKKGS